MLMYILVIDSKNYTKFNVTALIVIFYKKIKKLLMFKFNYFIFSILVSIFLSKQFCLAIAVVHYF